MLSIGLTALERIAGELAIAGLRHFLYKSRGHVQITHPAFEGDYEELHNRYRFAIPRDEDLSSADARDVRPD